MGNYITRWLILTVCFGRESLATAFIDTISKITRNSRVTLNQKEGKG